jgi:hypothetical protein
MGIHPQDTESLSRSDAKDGTDKLLATLQRHHGCEGPEPVKIEIKSEGPNPEVIRLSEEVEHLRSMLLSKNEIIKSLCGKDALALPQFSEIKQSVCEFYGITRANLESETRIPKYTIPRQIACYLGRELTCMSLPEIGRKLGGRDHTTILYAVNKIDAQLKTDEILRDDIDVLKVKIDDKVTVRKLIAEQTQ